MWLYKIVTELEIGVPLDENMTELQAWKMLETLYNKQGIDGWELVTIKFNPEDAQDDEAQIIAFFKKWEAD